MTTEALSKTKRCPAPSAASQAVECGSAVFYDWGLQIIEAAGWLGPDGQQIERYKDHGSPQNVKICARCTTPYILVGGDLVDISSELGAEDVKAILARGQATLPHVKIKDP